MTSILDFPEVIQKKEISLNLYCPQLNRALTSKFLQKQKVHTEKPVLNLHHIDQYHHFRGGFSLSEPEYVK